MSDTLTAPVAEDRFAVRYPAVTVRLLGEDGNAFIVLVLNQGKAVTAR